MAMHAVQGTGIMNDRPITDEERREWRNAADSGEWRAEWQRRAVLRLLDESAECARWRAAGAQLIAAANEGALGEAFRSCEVDCCCAVCGVRWLLRGGLSEVDEAARLRAKVEALEAVVRAAVEWMDEPTAGGGDLTAAELSLWRALAVLPEEHRPTRPTREDATADFVHQTMEYLLDGDGREKLEYDEESPRETPTAIDLYRRWCAEHRPAREGERGNLDASDALVIVRNSADRRLEKLKDEQQHADELAEALRDVLAFRLENGVHYCRGCSAGTRQGWQHEPHCRYAESERVSANARAALARHDSRKGTG